VPFERLGQVVVRLQPGGPHRHVQIGVARHDDAAQMLGAPLDGFQGSHTIRFTGQAHVGQKQVKITACGHGHGFLSILDSDHFIAFGHEQLSYQLAQVQVVFEK